MGPYLPITHLLMLCPVSSSLFPPLDWCCPPRRCDRTSWLVKSHGEETYGRLAQGVEDQCQSCVPCRHGTGQGSECAQAKLEAPWYFLQENKQGPLSYPWPSYQAEVEIPWESPIGQRLRWRSPMEMGNWLTHTKLGSTFSFCTRLCKLFAGHALSVLFS